MRRARPVRWSSSLSLGAWGTRKAWKREATAACDPKFNQSSCSSYLSLLAADDLSKKPFPSFPSFRITSNSSDLPHCCVPRTFLLFAYIPRPSSLLKTSSSRSVTMGAPTANPPSASTSYGYTPTYTPPYRTPQSASRNTFPASTPTPSSLGKRKAAAANDGSPEKKKPKKDPNAEKRLRCFRPRPPSNFSDVYNRALTQR